jgi:hypothetical protein
LSFHVEGRPNEKLIATVKALPFPLARREFIVKQICKKNCDGSASIVQFSPNSEEIDYGVKMNLTRGRSTTHVHAVNIESPLDDSKRCMITMTQKLDAGGFIPTSVVNSKIPESFSVLQEFIDEFKQDREVDASILGNMATIFGATSRRTPKQKAKLH